MSNKYLCITAVSVVICIAAKGLAKKSYGIQSVEQQPSIASSVTLENKQVVVGQRARVILTIRNITQQPICFSTASNLYKIHVEGTDGEAPRTEMYRHRMGEYHPGDGPDLVDGPVACSDIAPGDAIVRLYDLATFYDISKPGEYRVYMEVQDRSSGKSQPGRWFETNAVWLEVQTTPK